MLRKSWGLTLVGGLAMTIAIGIAVIVFTLVDNLFWPSLPLDEGDRVVAIQTWDEASHRRHNTAMEDVARWRESLQSVRDIGAFRTTPRSMVIDNAPTETVSVTAMTASGFRLARVSPIIGRSILDEDERDDASPVVVMSFGVWKTRFQGDPAITGRSIRFGGTPHAVIGVMPDGFAFPINDHYWIPLRVNAPGELEGGESEGTVFARLAPDASMESAEAELASLGLVATAGPDEELRPRIVSYPAAFTGNLERGEARWVISLVLTLLTLLLVPPCANIAILVYARTISRQREFAAGHALGASRGRIVTQLFLEVLVLAALSAVVARLAVGAAFSRVHLLLGPGGSNELPFWIDFGFSVRTFLFTAGLAVVAAIIAGLVPALKATGSVMQSGLVSLGNRGTAGPGATWTWLVVTQVALTIAVLPSAIELGWGTIRQGVLGPGFNAEEYLTARLAVDVDAKGRADDSFELRFGNLQRELIRQLEAEPGVLDVTTAAAAPGEEPWATIEIEGVPLPEESVFASANLIRFNHVEPAFFDVFDNPVLIGRGFDSGDLEANRHAVVVNKTLADELLGGESPLGRRVRYLRMSGRTVSAEEPWYEIVGVVNDLPANEENGTMYHAMRAGEVNPVSIAIHVDRRAPAMVGRLIEITSALDPTLRIEDVRSLDEIYHQQEVGNNLGVFALTIVTLSVLLLSAAGLYALMSFTLSQRRREIGIRAALGAPPLRLLLGTFRHALKQVSVGALIGAILALAVSHYLPTEIVGGWSVPGVIPFATAFMIAVGLLASAGPAARGLRVRPIEELREG